jgi:hypothetical protein
MNNTIIFLCFLSFSAFGQVESSFSTLDKLWVQDVMTTLDSIDKTNNPNILKNKDYFLCLNAIRVCNRKENPDLWKIQMQENVNLSVLILNRLGKYLKFRDPKEKRSNLIVPPCFVPDKNAIIVGQPTLDDFKDEDCKKIFLQMIADREYQERRQPFTSGVLKTCETSIECLIAMFANNKNTSIEELTTFLKTSDLFEQMDSNLKLILNNRIKSIIAYNNNQKRK